ncbi:hypothetical protein MMPV_010069 [Pyropia vietnamensis]
MPPAPVTGARQQPWPSLVSADRRDAAKTGEWPVDITYATPPDDAAGSSDGGASGGTRISGVTAHLDRRGGGDGGGRSRVPRRMVVPLEREPDGRAFTATAWLPAAVHTLEFHVLPAPVAEGEKRGVTAGGIPLVPPPGADHGWAPRLTMDGAAVSEPPLVLVVSPLGGGRRGGAGGDEEGEPGEAARVRAATAALEAVEAAAAARAAEVAAARAATSRKEVTWGAPVAEDASGAVGVPSGDGAAGLVATRAPPQSVTEPVAGPVDEPTTQPVTEPTTQPVTKPAVKPSPAPLAELAAASAVKPAAKLVAEPLPLPPPPTTPSTAKASAPRVAASAVATLPTGEGRSAKPVTTGGDTGGDGGSGVGGGSGRGGGGGGGGPLLSLVRMLMVGAGVIGGVLAAHAALTNLAAADGPDDEEDGGVDGGWKTTSWPAVGVQGEGRRRDSYEKECELYNRSELRD